MGKVIAVRHQPDVRLTSKEKTTNRAPHTNRLKYIGYVSGWTKVNNHEYLGTKIAHSTATADKIIQNSVRLAWPVKVHTDNAYLAIRFADTITGLPPGGRAGQRPTLPTGGRFAPPQGQALP